MVGWKKNNLCEGFVKYRLEVRVQVLQVLCLARTLHKSRSKWQGFSINDSCIICLVFFLFMLQYSFIPHCISWFDFSHVQCTVLVFLRYFDIWVIRRRPLNDTLWSICFHTLNVSIFFFSTQNCAH